MVGGVGNRGGAADRIVGAELLVVGRSEQSDEPGPPFRVRIASRKIGTRCYAARE